MWGGPRSFRRRVCGRPDRAFSRRHPAEMRPENRPSAPAGGGPGFRALPPTSRPISARDATCWRLFETTEKWATPPERPERPAGRGRELRPVREDASFWRLFENPRKKIETAEKVWRDLEHSHRQILLQSPPNVEPS